jgi:hypothetical protein
MREAKERRRDEQGEEARDGGGDEGRRERSDDDYSFLLEDIYLGPRSVSSLPDAWVISTFKPQNLRTSERNF